jgi:anhydro-N-acetylmuramic acid kinase
MQTDGWVIGLMSGTSIDGVDAALIRTDGRAVLEFGPWRSDAYDPAFRDRLRRVLGQPSAPDALIAELTAAHASSVRALLHDADMPASAIDLIGFHGQTLLHEPAVGRTVQIGDGAALAKATGIATINDFRSADVAAGGEGAPFAPLYHAALAGPLEKPVAVLNIGGVANVTWIGPDDQLSAFDTGPGNALLDDWMVRHSGTAMDRDGRLAATGKVDDGALQQLMANRYFDRPPPKSLDRDAFDAGPVSALAPADGAATLVAFTAASVAAARAHMPMAPDRWLVTGGGRHNPIVMAALQRALGAAVDPVEAVGWRGDALEAEAFGFLAMRSRLGLPLSVPTTTGVDRPMTGGRLWQ